MKFRELPLAGAYLVELEPHTDERGFFARAFCVDEFAAHGLDPRVAQCNISFNATAGTLRGMHYLTPPGSESKLVRCTRGAVHDVIVDMRAESPTYLQHAAVELTASNHLALYIPPLFAHGFLTLADETELFYLMSDTYAPGHEQGVRHDDPALGIDWPAPVRVVAERDRAWPLLAVSRS